MIEAGASLGAFRILEPLGEGGMGEVYLAEDTRLGRKVAIKVLAAHLQERQSARERLLREARAASALSHPHVCTLYDVGTHQDRLHIVMEYVEGTTLRELTPPGGLPAEQVVAYGRQIADALAHAHARGVVHRDLKGANVMITTEGRVKVLDFGLATAPALAESDAATSEWPDLTEPGTLLGTPLYMSPEQLRGETADARSDLWALGVVLHEALSGRPPFGGRTHFEISSAVLTEPAAALPPRTPPALAAVITRCLDKDPARRYQKASEARAALEVLQTALAAGLGAAGSGPVTESRLAAAALAPPAAADSVAVSSASGIRSVAVLPLANLSRDPEQEYFSDGMTEALINDLAQIGALKVISRTSAMRFKESDKPLPQIARELGVDGVLEGSVLRSGDKVRITAQLVHAASDTHLWADSYTGDLRDIFELQSRVAQAVAGRIRVAVTADERAQLAHPEEVNPQAHEAYLKARHGRNMITEEGLALGVRWAEKAIALDPDYARPYALLAEIYVLLGMYGYRRPREVFPLAKQKAALALALDEGLAEAHSTMGWAVQVHDFDREASEREYRRALDLNPGHEVTLMRYGACLVGLGEPRKGMAMLKRSIELDPLAPIMNAIYAYGLYLTRDYDGAIGHCRKMADWEPNFWWTYWDLGEAYAAKGMFREAIEAHQKAAELGRNPFTAGGLGAALARAGERAAAEGLLAKMQQTANERYIPPYFIALIQLALGDRSAALDSLERAWQERDSWVSFAAVTPALDELRSDPRFQALLDRMDLATAASGLPS